MIFFNFVIALMNISLCLSSLPGYYWRDLDDQIPLDAFVADKNNDGEYIYIIQFYLSKSHGVKGFNSGFYSGLHIGSIFAKTYNEFVVSNSTVVGDINLHTKSLKILCGAQKNFAWVSLTDDSRDILKYIKAVNGGHDENSRISGYYYIGRHKNLKYFFGMADFSFGMATIHFFNTSKVKEKIDKTFDVLTYGNSERKWIYEDVSEEVIE